MIKLADKVPMEFSPYVGPDSLREISRLLKNLYDLHTKRYCGYEDINGSQYEGTVENWGSELLLEARKILLDKPSLKNIFIENTMNFYFDIAYSGLTNTYDQENMLCAVLRKDVLLSNRTYTIRFDNVERIWIPRSQSSSDPDVYSDQFIHTTTPPTLVVEKEDGTTEEIQLKLTDIEGGTTDYYFHIDRETYDMFDGENYPDEDGMFMTLPLTDSMHGRACMWMCVDLLRTLPRVDIINNLLQNKQLLSIGTDGHDRSFLYPILNFKSTEINPDNIIIKIIPVESESFINNKKTEINYTSKVGEIHLLMYYDTPTIGTQPDVESVITYDDTYAKLTLARFEDNVTEWNFKTPVKGDYDYDGRTYNNKCYAYIRLTSFVDNFHDSFVTNPRIPLLRITFDDKYLHKYEGLCENAYSGIHVDVTSDKSNNGVSKKNGVIHDLGDYDGLPPYFKYMIDDTIHRAHVEAYAIRDKLNERNQNAVDKQTAGIIIDSAIPQNELQKVTANMPVVIYFDWHNQLNRNYTHDENDEHISKTNNLSEVTFVNDEKFGNSKMAKYQFNDKFVYHGNRHFSLGVIGFDPELEIGRVYIISNDKASYENNELTDHPKSPTTFARICDIPTEFSQLVNIKGTSPTVVIDDDYLRTEVSFSEDSKNLLYNLPTKDKILRYSKYPISPSYVNLNDNNVKKTLTNKFPKYIRLNESIDICDSENVSFSVGNPGEGYEVGDEFLIYIGGICIRGRVKTTIDDTVDTVVFLHYNSNDELVESETPVLSYSNINRSNFKYRETAYDAKPTTGSGEGLKIIITISSELWNSTAMTTSGVLDNLMLFKQDEYGNIWIWLYDNNTNEFIQTEQITGSPTHKNVNDSGKSVSNYKFTDVFINNLIEPISNDIKENNIRVVESLSNIPKTEDITSDTDYSHYINQDNKNVQNGLFILTSGLITSRYNGIVSYELGHIESTQESMAIDVYSDLNVPVYNNKTNKLRFHNVENSQPTLYLFDPTVSTIDTYTAISKDVVTLINSKPILLSEILMEYKDIPSNIVTNEGILTRHVYGYNEFSTKEKDAKRNSLNKLTREALIDMVSREFPGSLPVKYENTSYEYTKEMLINYIINNTLCWGRSASYTDGEETIYRRPEVSIFRMRDEQIVDKANRPVGDQPTGAFKEVTSEIVDTNVKVDNTKFSTKPWNVFRIDTDDEIINLDGFRMCDELNNDISDSTLLIINGVLYVAEITKESITWVKAKRPNIDEEEDN